VHCEVTQFAVALTSQNEVGRAVMSELFTVTANCVISQRTQLR